MSGAPPMSGVQRCKRRSFTRLGMAKDTTICDTINVFWPASQPQINPVDHGWPMQLLPKRRSEPLYSRVIGYTERVLQLVAPPSRTHQLEAGSVLWKSDITMQPHCLETRTEHVSLVDDCSAWMICEP